MNPANPLIVQSDRSIFLETFNALAEDARSAIVPFAELEKSPSACTPTALHLCRYGTRPVLA
ncbi:MAG: hypothetical protein AAF708_16590 [Deinococcota bacterium]